MSAEVRNQELMAQSTKQGEVREAKEARSPIVALPYREQFENVSVGIAEIDAPATVP